MSFKRIPSEPPLVNPIPDGRSRPLWSVMIPAYNCSKYLPLTLESVLKQAYAPALMQIKVVDDASTDANIKELVQDIGKGRVGYYQQAENVGSLRNYATCLNQAQGHHVHLLHGDDLVEDGYYNAIDSLFKEHPAAGAAFCRFQYIDEAGTPYLTQPAELSKDGILPNYLATLTARQRQQFCSTTVKRKVYETVGGFYGVTYGEDWEMWLRIAQRYNVAYTPQTLASYRMHSNSISGRAFITGQNMRDLNWVLHKAKSYLPANSWQKPIAEAKKFYSRYALKVANRLWHTSQDRQGVKNQVSAAWSMHQQIDPVLYWYILKLYIKILIKRI